jgi:hypothetical protein
MYDFMSKTAAVLPIVMLLTSFLDTVKLRTRRRWNNLYEKRINETKGKIMLYLLVGNSFEFKQSS